MSGKISSASKNLVTLFAQNGKRRNRVLIISAGTIFFGLLFYYFFQLTEDKAPIGFARLEHRPFQNVYLVPSSLSKLSTADVTAYVVVQIGEADLIGPEGLLHYVEHLAWLNAVKNSTDRIDTDSNAWTNSRSVGYWLTGPKSKLKDNLEKLVRVFDKLNLANEFALQERDIIQREYDLRQSDNLEVNIAESLDKILYQGNGLARSVIGKKTDIENFSLQDAMALHNKTHFPENAILIVVGDISAHELIDALPKVVAQKLPIRGGAEFILKNEDIRKSVTFSGNSFNEKLVWRRVIELPISLNYDLLAIQCDLLKDILSADLPGGLAKPLRFDAFVTSSFEISVSAIDERHVELRFVGIPDKNVELKDVKEAFETELTKSAKRGIPAGTFESILTRYLKDLPDKDNEIAVSEWTEKYVLERISSQRIPMAIASLQNLRKDLTKPAIDTLLRQLVGKGRTAIAFVRKEGAP
jgi:hypothetical protein